MPKPPEMPKKTATVVGQKMTPIISQPVGLKVWTCPVCNRNHYGFARNICRNEKCSLFGREASR